MRERVLNCWRCQLALMVTLLSYVLLVLPMTPWHSAYCGLVLNLESVGVCCLELLSEDASWQWLPSYEQLALPEALFSTFLLEPRAALSEDGR